LLVEFYAPWCGHCKKLDPEYASAAETLSKNDPPFALAKVDATEQKKVAEEFGVQGFPTLKWFHNGEATEYQGGRTADTIVAWILKKTGPASAELDCAALAEKTASNKFTNVFFGDVEDALYTAAHIGWAGDEDKVQFYHNSDAACATEHGVSGNGIVFFRQFEEKQNAYTGEATADALKAWAKPLQVPTVFSFTEDEIEAVFGQQQNTLVLFRSEDDDQADFMTVFREAATVHKGKMLFSYAGTANAIQGKLAEFMGVTPEDFPTLRAITPSNMKKFRAESAKDLTVESIGAFLDGIADGSVKAHLKSAAPPAEQGNVVIVVGTEFESIVMDETKDVLVKYYAPWCGHCKKLAPIWDDLGEAYKDIPDLVIAKFDATENEADGVDIRGYPTLKWYPKDNKAGVDYEGDRELPDFKKFLEEKSEALKETPKQEEL